MGRGDIWLVVLKCSDAVFIESRAGALWKVIVLWFRVRSNGCRVRKLGKGLSLLWLKLATSMLHGLGYGCQVRVHV